MKKRICLLLSMSILIVLGCGHRLNKQALTAESYFEYAKKKFDKKKYLESISEFNAFVLKFSGHSLVDDAQYLLAESHYNQGEYLLAISEYEKLVNDYPRSSYNVTSQYKVGLCYAELSFRPELDQEYTRKALRHFQNFIDMNPEEKLVEDARKQIHQLDQKLAEKWMLGGNTYRKMKLYSPAVIYYDLVLENYSNKEVVSKAYFWKAECLFKLQKFAASQNAFSTFTEKYPEHKYADKAKKRIEKIASLLETTQLTP